MAEISGPKIGDARSLWNFTPSPGWTREEAHALSLCLKKFGIGKWVQIVDSGVLPGKQIQQLNGQTQRLLGQQSLAEFTGMCVDVDAIRADNNLKQGPEIYRKSGLITNQGGKLSKEELKAQREANFKKYGLSQEEVDAIELPAPPRAVKLGADAYMGKNHNKGGIAGVKTRRVVKRQREADILTVDVDALSRPAKLLLLSALRKRLIFLQNGGEDDAAPNDADAAAVEEERVLKEKNTAAAKEGVARGGKKTTPPKGQSAAGGSGKGTKKKGASKEAPGQAEAPPTKRRAASSSVDDDAVQQLVAMGFDAAKARDAVLETGGDVMECVNWLVANCA